ncbi:GFA family protein, partial [Pseudomonas aeruginosa]|nr:GFA family protein [Pseudomonas aeruginosa]
AMGPCGQAMPAVNTRCLVDIDASAPPVQHYDGRNP